VAASVAVSVLLIACASGVQRSISGQVDNQALRQAGLSSSTIDASLGLLTSVVIGAVLVETAAATFILGLTVMRSRREEIAIRRQSGVFRSTLLWEFVRSVFGTCLLGGLLGEVIGATAARLLEVFTVLPVTFTLVSLAGAFPVTIVLALGSTLIPAWMATGASPSLLRRER
jgi:ABC-type antimicrobial peptide transport system permease subunit